MKNTVRIIGGRYRGKKIQFPSIPDLRPTTDRVKETVFNWLMNDIQNSCCLDAFAGSGSLGFEAISRGAREVILLETHMQAIQALKSTANSLSNSSIHILQMDVLHYLKQTVKVFDIIFLDPPFKSNYLPGCLELIRTQQCLSANGLIYVETNTECSLDKHWEIIKKKQAGQVLYMLLKAIPNNEILSSS